MWYDDVNFVREREFKHPFHTRKKFEKSPDKKLTFWNFLKAAFFKSTLEKSPRKNVVERSNYQGKSHHNSGDSCYKVSMDANIKKAIAILLGMKLAEIDVDSLLGKRKRRREANEIRDRKAHELFVDS